jgi:hypothetical protein
VVLDIGEDIGSLIVHTDSDLHGTEVEISPTGDDQQRSHKEVLERECAGQPAFTAVFDALAAGRYTVWTNGEPRSRAVSVESGRVVQLDWRVGCQHVRVA